MANIRSYGGRKGILNIGILRDLVDVILIRRYGNGRQNANNGHTAHRPLQRIQGVGFVTIDRLQGVLAIGK